jgi:hypothetical protein
MATCKPPGGLLVGAVKHFKGVLGNHTVMPRLPSSGSILQQIECEARAGSCGGY